MGRWSISMAEHMPANGQTRRLLLDSRVVDVPRASNLMVVSLPSLKPFFFNGLQLGGALLGPWWSRRPRNPIRACSQPVLRFLLHLTSCYSAPRIITQAKLSRPVDLVSYAALYFVRAALGAELCGLPGARQPQHCGAPESLGHAVHVSRKSLCSGRRDYARNPSYGAR